MALKSSSAAGPLPAERAGLTSPRVTPLPYLATSVGKKVVMAITGLLLGLYLVLHLAGNLLLFLGPPTFNAYSHFLIANPLIVPVEIGLLATFLIHIYEALVNWVANRQARPVGYYQPIRRYFGYGWAGKPSRKSIASTTMIVSGVVIVLFVLVHLLQFKFGPEYAVTSAASGTVGERDLYRLEIENFSNAVIVGFYALCMVVIGFHLWHGISSALNSLGVDHPRSTPTILRITRVVAVVLAAGFLFIPIWVFFMRG
jgi:succinate dehydrogenase / fumarate reductase cytochrome b subunit